MIGKAKWTAYEIVKWKAEGESYEIIDKTSYGVAKEAKGKDEWRSELIASGMAGMEGG